MEIKPAVTPAPKPIPTARPARKPLISVRTDPDGEEVLEGMSRWELSGWMWSLGAHALLLLILGLWYFAPPATKVKSFDTRLAGTEFGSEDGMSSTGGLDTPLPPPEAMAPGATELTPTKLQASDILPDPTAGFTGKTDNPGAGKGDGFGLSRFGNGGENVRGVTIKVGDPQFTLLWDSTADLDLHVIEPGGKEIFWNDRKGRLGGELDVDNVDGFGPENIYWLTKRDDGTAGEPGPGPPGEYRWFVQYWGGNNGIPVKTRWKVRVKHDGKVEMFGGQLNKPNGRSQTYTLKVRMDSVSESTSAPVAASTR